MATDECDECDGTGEIECTCPECGDRHVADCDNCFGSGFVDNDDAEKEDADE